jgi:signal transduction histidine kinase
MKRPWQYWLLFAIGLVITVATLGWLTRETLELDRAEASARRQTELEENIGRALWRMDVRLMPFIAKEAARPYFVYQPFYVQPPSTADTRSPAVASPSPLLTERPEFVVLSFQVDPANHWSSAQLPAAEQRQQAIEYGAQPAIIFQCENNMASLRSEVDYSALVGLLPMESVTDMWTDPTLSEKEPTNVRNKYVDNPFNALAEDNSTQQFAAPSQAQQNGQIGGESVRLQRQQSLNTSDLANRDANFQILAQREFETQRANFKTAPATTAREGICRPVWIGSRLLLARRVELQGQVVVQGCWLDWPRIKQVLLAEAADLLPTVELEPVLDPANARVNRMLATLPVQLVVPVAPLADGWSPMRTTLAIAWIGVSLLAVVGGVLLHGVLSLSERRATFVSAVTHELRTPLTTFRLYSDMLAQGMLPDPEQRQKYLETLRVEADRLARLVDNVLAFARLERGRAGSQRIRITLRDLIDRCWERLTERAAQAELKLTLEPECDLDETTLITDPSAIEQILFNLVDNAAKYAGRGADRRLQLKIQLEKKHVAIRLVDHGPGLAYSAQRKLFQPFSKSAEDAAHSAPGVGLGLALCRRLAREIGGQLSLAESSSKGATFLLVLPR